MPKLSPAVSEQLGWYVYRLTDPKDDSTIYIGKGAGPRILQHIKEARNSRSKLSRKVKKIRAIMRRGDSVMLWVHRHGLTQKEAFEIEAALIDLFPDAVNEVKGTGSYDRGMRSLEEVIAQYAAAPARIKEPVVLINIGREWFYGLPNHPESLYQRTRRWWIVNPIRRKAKYAMAVSHGIIRQVYRIEKWTKRSVRLRKRAKRTRVRWQFAGVVAPEMQRYIGKSVAHYRQRGSQNPITYRNC